MPGADPVGAHFCLVRGLGVATADAALPVPPTATTARRAWITEVNPRFASGTRRPMMPAAIVATTVPATAATARSSHVARSRACGYVRRRPMMATAEVALTMTATAPTAHRARTRRVYVDRVRTPFRRRTMVATAVVTLPMTATATAALQATALQTARCSVAFCSVNTGIGIGLIGVGVCVCVCVGSTVDVSLQKT